MVNSLGLRWGALVLAALLSSAVAPRALRAQASIRGHVLREATRAPIAGADVSLVGAEEHATTDSAGAFVLDDLPEGWAIIQVRKVGFAVRRDTVNIRTGRAVVRDFLLISQASLDTVKTVSTTVKYISPALRAFEERRQNASSGYFIPEAELRKADDKSLASFIVQRVSGLMPLTQSDVGTNLVSSRRKCSGPIMSGGKCQACYVTTYLDGVLLFASNGRTDIPPVDFNRLPVNEMAAVEFYPDQATAPVQYNATSLSASCGLLLLWTRER
jgi:Carboxypeptidase regulatory-like domain